MNIDPILAEMLDATAKGYPLSAPALPISAIGAQRWSVLNGDLPLPLAVIRDSALAHNHARSEERRVGKECSLGGAPDLEKEKGASELVGDSHLCRFIAALATVKCIF